MPIILNDQLQEQIPHTATEFPITYYHDELVTLPNWEGPLHWHTDFEIATAAKGVLDYQIGQQHIVLEAGDSISFWKRVTAYLSTEMCCTVLSNCLATFLILCPISFFRAYCLLLNQVFFTKNTFSQLPNVIPYLLLYFITAIILATRFAV